MTAAIQVSMVRLAQWITLLGQAEEAPAVDGNTRARWILALIGLLILGVGWIVIVWLAGRMTRRFIESDSLGTPSVYSEFGRSEWVRTNSRRTQDEHDINAS